VAVKALTGPEYAGQSLPITGPEALSYADMTAKIGAVIGKALRFEAFFRGSSAGAADRVECTASAGGSPPVDLSSYSGRAARNCQRHG